ncbi:MAG TPA: toll/interleukin-1 receptor domain-containing protein [Thermoanaerobaculia bacterium]|nr:toll/interleukin-1 receptor domain-containing protein [Thermoanaerobaculia bacterium]
MLFISYAREDRPVALEIARVLTERLAERQIRATGDWDLVAGAKYEPQLEQMIRAADALVFILSKDSAASPACLKELAKAAADGKRIVPVVLRQVPDEQIPAEILEPQWVFAQDQSVDTVAAEIAGAVLTDFALVSAHTELLTAARLWEGGRGPLLDRKHLKQARDVLTRLASNPQPYPAATALQHRYVEESAAAGRRRRWIFAGTAGAVFIIVALLGLIARQQAEARRAENGLRLAFTAQAEALGSPERLLTSGWRAAEALQLWPSSEADAALRKALSLLPRRLAIVSTGFFEKLAFAPDSRHFAAIELRGLEKPRLLRVWRTADSRLVTNVEDVETFVFLSPHRIAMLSESGKLRLLDLPSRVVSGPYPTVEDASSLVADRAGRWFAVAQDSRDQSAVAIHDGHGTMRGSRVTVPGSALGMRFDDQSARLAIVSNHGFMGVISIADMSVRSRTARNARDPIHFFLDSCVFTRGASWDLNTADQPCGDDDRGIVSVSPDEGFFAIETPEGARLESTEASWVAMKLPDQMRGLTFAEDDRFFAYATPRTVHLFDGIARERVRICFDEREVFHEAGNRGPIEEFAVSPDGSRIIVTMQRPDGDGDPRLSIYDTSGFHARSYIDGASREFAPTAASSKGLVAVANGSLATLFDSRTGTILRQQEFRDEEADRTEIDALAFAPDGTILALDGRTLWRWDAAPGKFERLVAAPEDVQLELDPDGRVYAEKMPETTVVRDLGSKRALTVIQHSDLDPVTGTPDGTLFAAGDRDGNVSLWWRNHRQPGLEKAARGKAVTTLRFSYDGSLLAAAIGDWGGLRGSNTRDGEVVIWHTRSRRLRRVFPHPETVWDVDFSRDGRYVASVAMDSKVRVWDIRTGRQLSEISLRSHTSSVRFCDDDRAIVAANEIHYWRAEDLLRVSKQRLVRN